MTEEERLAREYAESFEQRRTPGIQDAQGGTDSEDDGEEGPQMPQMPRGRRDFRLRYGVLGATEGDEYGE